MYDVATPMTFERYTGNWRGKLYGLGKYNEEPEHTHEQDSAWTRELLHGRAMG
jgi:hypothetical protein